LIKPTGSVRFGFISLKLKKSNRTQTEKKRAKPGKNRAKLEKTDLKPSQIEKTKPKRFEPVFILKTEPKPVGLNRFQFFKKKFQFNYFFYIKINRAENDHLYKSHLLNSFRLERLTRTYTIIFLA
jgi:hypothetical protein